MKHNKLFGKIQAPHLQTTESLFESTMPVFNKQYCFLYKRAIMGSLVQIRATLTGMCYTLDLICFVMLKNTSTLVYTIIKGHTILVI